MNTIWGRNGTANEDVAGRVRAVFRMPADEWHELWPENAEVGHAKALEGCAVLVDSMPLPHDERAACVLRGHTEEHHRFNFSEKSENDTAQRRKEEVLDLISKASPQQMTHVLSFLRDLAHALLLSKEGTPTNNTSSSDPPSRFGTQARYRRRNLLGATSAHSLLEILDTMDEAGALGVGIRMRTVYENIVNPITNAIAEQLPTIIFTLTKFPIAIQMRDSLSESLKDMMTAPTLSNLDPAGPGAPPSFLETMEHAGTSASSAPIESASEGLGNMIAMDTADAISTELSDSLWKALKNKLEDSISNAVSRQTVRSLNTILTGALSHTVSRLAVELASLSLTRSMSKLTNQAIIAALTNSVSMTVTHALTRKPKSDYYCHYCMTHNLYCDRCRKITADEYRQDHYVSYYSKYFAKYYAYYYGGAFSDAAVDEYLIRGKRMQN